MNLINLIETIEKCEAVTKNDYWLRKYQHFDRVTVFELPETVYVEQVIKDCLKTDFTEPFIYRQQIVLNENGNVILVRAEPNAEARYVITWDEVKKALNNVINKYPKESKELYVSSMWTSAFDEEKETFTEEAKSVILILKNKNNEIILLESYINREEVKDVTNTIFLNN